MILYEIWEGDIFWGIYHEDIALFLKDAGFNIRIALDFRIKE